MCRRSPELTVWWYLLANLDPIIYGHMWWLKVWWRHNCHPRNLPVRWLQLVGWWRPQLCGNQNTSHFYQTPVLSKSRCFCVKTASHLIPLQLFSGAKQILPIPLLALASIYFCVFWSGIDCLKRKAFSATDFSSSEIKFALTRDIVFLWCYWIAFGSTLMMNNHSTSHY